MDPDARSYGIAGVVALCVVAGGAAVGTVLAGAPSKLRDDGTATSFAAPVLLEAGLLAGLVG